MTKFPPTKRVRRIEQVLSPDQKLLLEALPLLDDDYRESLINLAKKTLARRGASQANAVVIDMAEWRKGSAVQG